MDESERVVIKIFPVLGETATATQPTDGAFDDPAFRENDEAPELIAAPDNFGNEVRHDVCQTAIERRPRIGAVGKQLLKERKLAEQRGQ